MIYKGTKKIKLLFVHKGQRLADAGHVHLRDNLCLRSAAAQQEDAELKSSYHQPSSSG